MSRNLFVSALAVVVCTSLLHAHVNAQTPFPGPCRADHDDYTDGTVDRTMITAYDEQNRVQLEGRDLDDNGTPDHGSHYFYDDEGRVSVEQDIGADSSPVYHRSHYEYDEQGRLHRIDRYLIRAGDEPTEANDVSGSLDRRTEYTYDRHGRVSREGVSYTPDAQRSEVTTYEYDEDGRVVREQKDTRSRAIQNTSSIRTSTTSTVVLWKVP